MRLDASDLLPSSLATKSDVPDRAIVPRLRCSSSRVMPTPESVITSRGGSSYERSVMLSAGAASSACGSVNEANRSFSSASPALEMSSRRKTSLGGQLRACGLATDRWW